MPPPLRPLCLLLAAAAAAPVTAVATPWNCNSTAPRQVHLALTEAADGMLFSWSTGTPIWAANASCAPPQPNATSPAVRFGLAPGAYGAPVTSDYSLMYLGLGDITHRVNVTGLAPRTRYYYVVGDVALQQWSPEFSFVSRPPAGAEEVLDFIAYGDMGYFNGSATVVQAAIAAELASPQSRNYSFTTHIGDISYSGLEAQNDVVKDTLLWDLFMDEIAPISSRMPYLVAPGNHDTLPGNSGFECGVVYVHRFKMPRQNESSTAFDCATSQNVVYWYSLALGPVWLHSFSTEHSYAPGSPQLAWIEADLAAAAAARDAGAVSWLVVQMHYPSYCSHSYDGGGGCIHDAPLMRAQLEPLWLKYRVDTVMYGHIHAAEVTWPVANATPTQLNFVKPQAPVHFLIGMAGAGYLGPWQPAQPAWSAWRDQIYGWTRFHVEGSRSMTFEFFNYTTPGTESPAWTMTIEH